MSRLSCWAALALCLLALGRHRVTATSSTCSASRIGYAPDSRVGDGGSAAVISSAAAHSDFNCMTACAMTGCQAMRWLRAAGVCQMSHERNAKFPATDESALVLRAMPVPLPRTTSEVTRDTRQFRVIQQRQVGVVNFARDWTEYENGFGDETDFWIGLKTIHLLTQPAGTTLRVELTRYDNVEYHAEYPGFVVYGAAENYWMNYTQFVAGSPDAGDCLYSNKNKPFSTKDRDNDDYGGSCSTSFHGSVGWWFGGCTQVNPNGRLKTESELATVKCDTCIFWGNYNYPLKSIRLLLQLPSV